VTGSPEPRDRGFSFDTSVPHVARVYDYWLGGRNNFAADRAVAERVIALYPGVRAGVRAQRAFLGRVVRYLTAEAGIRQFLDIGTGLPSADNTHEVAQRTAPESRIVYVDNDPIVLTHARSLLKSSPEGATAFIDADVRDTGTIMAEAAGTLDFGKPVAVLLLGVLHCVPDADNPAAIVRRLLAALPAGSYLAIVHIASDVAEEATRSMREYGNWGAPPVTPRTYAQVSHFFDGLDLVPPGVVQVHRWRPAGDGPGIEYEEPNYGGVARKP
jgi:S-adenosyl methyltransferase